MINTKKDGLTGLVKGPASAGKKTDFTGLKLLLLALGAAVILAGIRVPYNGGVLVYPGLLLVLIVILVPSVKKVNEWERAIVLRLGRFHKVKGPGLVFLIPVIDRFSHVIDIRIRVTDFSAQETLTADSVTVTVDAFAFWLVWDPQKAALEVEDYTEAVELAGKAALRNAVSSNSLSTFLERGDIIENHIQEEVEKQTTEWGITVQYIEITDVQIPQELQDSLSRVAQAEREKKGRILLAEAEIEIARKLQEAVGIYSGNEPALKLKILSILNEGLKAGNSMILVPNSMAEELKTKDIFGLEALNELRLSREKKDGREGEKQ
ncbi:MAG: slipin family protein [Treponema sp.]|jgi:regulator of protease activity HflC (stomatin/prohibitin superfamily)|nr:slipin family protein [Treponema sp.]